MVIFFNIQVVLDIRAPERINTLGIVTYHTDILMDSREPFYDQILGKIRVLVLVNHDVPELVLVLVQGFGGVSEKDIGFEEQVIKIIGSGLRSEEHTSELQSLMRISYAASCLKKKKTDQNSIL